MEKFKNYARVLPCSVALLLGVLAAGCGGGGGQDPILGGAGVAALAPTVTALTPLANATGVPTTTKTITAAFSTAMNPATLTNASFTLACPAGTPVTGAVSYSASGNVATLTLASTSELPPSTVCTATVTTAATNVAGSALAANKVWNFTTATVAGAPAASPPPGPASVTLASAAAYGTFGGTAGMTNTGTLTLINGSIGTTATGTSSVTGFHDTSGDIYTETPANIGAVNGTIYTCTHSTIGPTSAGVNAAACSTAGQALLEANAAYNALVAMPAGANPGGNLANLTLPPGVYTAPAGSFMVQGGDLTLDGQGNADAVWVFQMATTLSVGGPGAAFPQSIILAGGAQAKNVYWQVGSFATINAAGGGTMVGTIISQAGAAFSTAGNTTIVTLQGRALSLGASVTLVDTVINVPAP